MTRVLIYFFFIFPVLAAAQGYPNRALHMIVPFAPGGASDFVGRILQPRMSELLGQQVIVENRGGAAGNIGVEAGARAAPDGYTFVLGNIGSIAINPAVFPNLSVTPTRDLLAVTQVVDVPSVLVAHPSFPPNNIKEVIAFAKANPGKTTYSSSGPGGSMHLAGALFEKETHTDLLHVPYKGGGPAIADLIAGHVDISFATILESSGHIKGGRLRALAVTSDKRYPTLPDVPPLSESGLRGFNTGSWIGLVAPAGTPKDIVDKVARDVREIVNSPEVRDQFIAQGATPVGGTPAEFAALIIRERERYAQIIRERNITAE